MENVAIDIKNLSFSYNNYLVLDAINAIIKENSVIALLGVNGAGKTTFFKCITNILKIKSGNIKIFSNPIENIAVKNLAKIVSYVGQLGTLQEKDYIVRDFIVEGRTPYLKTFDIPHKEDYLIVEKYARIVGIDALLGKNMQNLSGGQLQLVSITRALVQETPIIIMDEPMSALDINNQVSILKLIKQLQDQGKTIIFSTHNPNHAFVLNCDVCILKDTKIATLGPVQECLTSSVLQQIYGNNLILREFGEHKYCEFKLI